MEARINDPSDWIADMLLGGLILTPILTVLKVLGLAPLPWGLVILPLWGGFHLLASSALAKALVEVLLAFLRGPGR